MARARCPHHSSQVLHCLTRDCRRSTHARARGGPHAIVSSDCRRFLLRAHPRGGCQTRGCCAPRAAPEGRAGTATRRGVARRHARLRADPGRLGRRRRRPGAGVEPRGGLGGRGGAAAGGARHDLRHLLDLQAVHCDRGDARARRGAAAARRPGRRAPAVLQARGDAARLAGGDGARPAHALGRGAAGVRASVLDQSRFRVPDDGGDRPRARRAEDALPGGALLPVLEPRPLPARAGRRADQRRGVRRLRAAARHHAAGPGLDDAGAAGGGGRPPPRHRLRRARARRGPRGDAAVPDARGRAGGRVRLDRRRSRCLRLVAVQAPRQRRRGGAEGEHAAGDAAPAVDRPRLEDHARPRILGRTHGRHDAGRAQRELSRLPHDHPSRAATEARGDRPRRTRWA